ncbi:hypothetical protein JYT87_00675 [Nitrospira defluvii]|nr:hypothetical protein [Nitrospira defluvii]
MKTFFKQSDPIGISKFHSSDDLDLIRFITVVVIWCLLPMDILASQSDQRLDPLFNRLQTTMSRVEAQTIEITIWKIWIESDQDEVNRLMQAGISAMEKLDYGTALKVFDKVIAIAPNFAEGWNKRATVHYLQKDFAASIKDIQRTLNLEPRHFVALSGLGLVFMEMEQFDSALRAFKDALKVHPHLRGAKANVDAIRKLLDNVQI